MKVFHGTSQANLLSVGADGGLTAPSYWAGSFEQAKGYADTFPDGVVLQTNTDDYDFRANMQVAQCLLDSGDLQEMALSSDLEYSLEYLEGIVCFDTVRNFEAVQG